MDLFKFTFQMLSIRQEVAHSMEQEALRAQPPGSHWPAQPQAPLKGAGGGAFPQASRQRPGLLRPRSEAERQLEH